MRGEADLVSEARARARAIVEALRGGEPASGEVFEAFAELDALPADAVREALDAWTGPPPDPERLDAATRRAHGMPPPALRLRSLAVVRDADVLDLGPVAEQQLRLGGSSWDGTDRPPEDRLDDELDGSFAGTLEHRVLVDAETSEPCFDALLYAGDAGLVFRAGTSAIVARIAEGRVETTDRRIRVALEAALADRDKSPRDRSSRGLPGARSSRALPHARSSHTLPEAKSSRRLPDEQSSRDVGETATKPAAAKKAAAATKPATKTKKAAAATKKAAAAATKPATKTKKAAGKKPATAKKAAAKKPSTTAKKAATKKKAAAKKPSTTGKKAAAKVATTNKKKKVATSTAKKRVAKKAATAKRKTTKA